MSHFWKQRDGSLIALEKMASKHLAHAYRMCSKKAEEAKDAHHTAFWHSDQEMFWIDPWESARLMKRENFWIGWASTLSKELSSRGYKRIGQHFVKDAI